MTIKLKSDYTSHINWNKKHVITTTFSSLALKEVAILTNSSEVRLQFHKIDDISVSVLGTEYCDWKM